MTVKIPALDLYDLFIGLQSGLERILDEDPTVDIEGKNVHDVLEHLALNYQGGILQEFSREGMLEKIRLLTPKVGLSNALLIEILKASLEGLSQQAATDEMAETSVGVEFLDGLREMIDLHPEPQVKRYFQNTIDELLEKEEV